MNIPELIAITLAVTQFVKEFFAKFRIIISGKGAILLSCVISAVVVIYFRLGTTFNFIQVLTDFIQVAIGANMGYKIMAGKASVK